MRKRSKKRNYYDKNTTKKRLSEKNKKIKRMIIIRRLEGTVNATQCDTIQYNTI